MDAWRLNLNDAVLCVIGPARTRDVTAVPRPDAKEPQAGFRNSGRSLRLWARAARESDVRFETAGLAAAIAGNSRHHCLVPIGQVQPTVDRNHEPRFGTGEQVL